MFRAGNGTLNSLKLQGTCLWILMRFFSRLHDVHNVDGKVIDPGKTYEIHFLECNCPLHTQMHVNVSQLCEYSRRSIIYELGVLFPNCVFDVQEV